MTDLASQDTTIGAETRRRLRTELPNTLRCLYRDVLSTTLSSGVPVNPTALVVVLCAHVDSTDTALRFTSDHVSELLWFGIQEFCEDRDFVVPSGCTEALHAVLATASSTEVLSVDSDKPRELFQALEGLHAS